jgi:hypothetical protein
VLLAHHGGRPRPGAEAGALLEEWEEQFLFESDVTLETVGVIRPRCDRAVDVHPGAREECCIFERPGRRVVLKVRKSFNL